MHLSDQVNGNTQVRDKKAPGTRVRVNKSDLVHKTPTMGMNVLHLRTLRRLWVWCILQYDGPRSNPVAGLSTSGFDSHPEMYVYFLIYHHVSHKFTIWRLLTPNIHVPVLPFKILNILQSDFFMSNLSSQLIHSKRHFQFFPTDRRMVFGVAGLTTCFFMLVHLLEISFVVTLICKIDVRNRFFLF